MATSLCRLLVYVNHALVANFNVANMSFNAIRENKFLAKISEFTVIAASDQCQPRSRLEMKTLKYKINVCYVKIGKRAKIMNR